jgi:ubiquitin C-terminal hydrolase
VIIPQPLPPKCKNIYTRKNGFRLLQHIARHGAQGICQFLRTNLLSKAYWRSRAPADWRIQPALSKGKNAYVGLKNLGCTCYLNSLMQQLFMIREFSDSIIKVSNNSKVFDNILYSIKFITFKTLSIY